MYYGYGGYDVVSKYSTVRAAEVSRGRGGAAAAASDGSEGTEWSMGL
jgi:hypothetical protein